MVQGSVDERSDAALMAGILAGDQSALGVLYDRHGDAVFRRSYRLLGDRGLAEEVLQETILAVWNRAELYDPRIASLPAWLMTIARNRSVDRLRARGRRPALLSLNAAVASAGSDGAALDVVLAGGRLVAAAPMPPEPEAVVDAAGIRETVLAALAGLPADERRAIELAYYGELSQSEIAERLGWPLGTVKTRTRRALLRLRGMLAEALGPESGARVAPTPMPGDAPPGGIDGPR